MARTQAQYERQYREAAEQFPKPFPDLDVVGEPWEWCQATDCLTWDEAVVVSAMEGAMMDANLAWDAEMDAMAREESPSQYLAAFNAWAR